MIKVHKRKKTVREIAMVRVFGGVRENQSFKVIYLVPSATPEEVAFEEVEDTTNESDHG